MIQQGTVGFPAHNWIDAHKAPLWLSGLDVRHKLFSHIRRVFTALVTGKFESETRSNFTGRRQ